MRVRLKRLAQVGILSAAVFAIRGECKTDDTNARLLKHATLLFSNASHHPADLIPDTVLNRTKCMVLVAAGAEGRTYPGLADCRDTANHWGSPEFVDFKPSQRVTNGEVLVLILHDAAVRLLRSGRLKIRSKDFPAPPLVSTKPIPSQSALNSELLVYQYSTTAISAAGGRVEGMITNMRLATNMGTAKAPQKLVNEFLSALDGYFNTIKPTGIVLHHTALIPGENRLPKDAREVGDFHEQRGFEIRCSNRLYHEAYHFLIFPDGHVKKGRPETCEGAHAEGYNSFLGISLVGDFSSEDNPTGQKGPIQPSDKQIQSLVRLCRRMKDRYHIPLDHIVRHADVSRTRCPGDRFPFDSVLQQIGGSKR
jgi:hypothetical protein